MHPLMSDTYFSVLCIVIMPIGYHTSIPHSHSSYRLTRFHTCRFHISKWRRAIPRNSCSTASASCCYWKCANHILTSSLRSAKLRHGAQISTQKNLKKKRETKWANTSMKARAHTFSSIEKKRNSWNVPVEMERYARSENKHTHAGKRSVPVSQRKEKT